MVAAAVFAIALPFSCGYRVRSLRPVFAGAGARFAVGTFENTTPEVGVDSLVVQALRAQLTQAGALTTASNALEIDGRVTGIAGAPMVALPGRLPSYSLSGTLEVRVRDGANVIRSASVVEREEYPAGADVLLTDLNRQAAVRRLCTQLASRAYEAISVEAGE